jgi:hypothetical protein
LVAGAAYVLLFLMAIVDADKEMLQALTIAPVLFGVTVPIAMSIARRDGDRTIATIIMAGVSAKLLMAYVQFQVAYSYYGGRVDAQRYHETGALLAPAYRRLDFTTDIGELTGSGYVRVITGLIYAL